MLRELRLRDFRCFEHVVFQPSPGLNFLVGPNAQGKTSLLEAACVLLRLQSPRTSSLAEAVRFGQPGFGIDGHWNDQHLQVKCLGALKSFTLDSKPQARSADYLAVARVAWIANDDLTLVRGGGAQRRRFLDFLGAQATPDYLRRLRAYERALRSRNALLRDNRPRREIRAFDAPLLEAGAHLLAARAALCETLSPLTTAACRSISGGGESLALTYQPGSGPDFAEELVRSEAEEIRSRTTVTGPHRDDVEILLEGRRAATFASEGQQRTIALALKLAQAQALADRGASPLYLIDDVFGELDANRRNALLAALPSDAQKLVTTTAVGWLDGAGDAVRHGVGGGSVRTL